MSRSYIKSVIQSGDSADLLTIDPSTKTLRATHYPLHPDTRLSFSCGISEGGSGVLGTGDLCWIEGSASKVVEVTRIDLCWLKSSGQANAVLYAAKRSSLNSGGTYDDARLSPVNADSSDAAYTATVHHLSSRTGMTPGALIGNIWSAYILSSLRGSYAAFDDPKVITINFNLLLGRPLVLRSSSEMLAVGSTTSPAPSGWHTTGRIFWNEY